MHQAKEGPNKGKLEPTIIRKIPLQNISKVSARFVADGCVYNDLAY